ncbi:hypothetical protein PCCS19_16580 [Paenibacillus sp. CCS19]|uniref:cyclic lactone autoinducer peptide n=1 Tax=Paenibacillus sp. CCS19 TaxID=3158387 RepID=UPI00255E2A90|nr:cyclic lactone autoinducer peptide [Paenibacillus cellulosilyticus]GMK38604.1 hypothetical protein PCCS19_16580 [Paenibacillus cellulosilyticus]
MKNMSERMVEGIKDQLSKTMGRLAIKTGEVTMETSCLMFGYEPSIPQELLKSSSK